MGPGTHLEKRLARGDPGINRLDKIAKAHDIDYARAKNLKDKWTADRKMIAKIDKLPEDVANAKNIKQLWLIYFKSYKNKTNNCKTYNVNWISQRRNISNKINDYLVLKKNSSAMLVSLSSNNPTKVLNFAHHVLQEYQTELSPHDYSRRNWVT
ncbi:unnamed protein product [Porites lobata]|uniref:Uncharacterized protein n=1 Tax=Porites lobata TaxID=104759 RepID=A0ABN8QP94_9CNID|nr:unnamed protein product [Porites lobata]